MTVRRYIRERQYTTNRGKGKYRKAEDGRSGKAPRSAPEGRGEKGSNQQSYLQLARHGAGDFQAGRREAAKNLFSSKSAGGMENRKSS